MDAPKTLLRHFKAKKKSTREKHSSWTRRPFSAAIVVIVVIVIVVVVIVIVVVVVVIVAVAVVSSTCLSAPLSEKTEARARRSHRSEELPVRFIGHQNLGLKKRQNSKYSCSNFFVTVKKAFFCSPQKIDLFHNLKK